MFGTSGIRGIYGTEISPELALKIGNAVGQLNKKIVLGYDTRESSPVLANAAAAGAMQAGCDVIDIGVVPTPMLAFVSANENCDGIMITASHNPAEYNGIKLFSNGAEYTKEKEKKIEELYNLQKTVEWNKAGQKFQKNYEEDYINYLISKINADLIKRAKPKVLIDAGNAAAYKIAPLVFQKLGCEVITYLCDSPGKFERNLEPNNATLAKTAKIAKEKNCDFGIAFDGDADRAIAIDENGEILPLDNQLAMFCEYFLSKKKGKIITTVEASLLVRETIKKLNGEIIITPVGSANVALEVKKQNAIFGGEPCGEYIFPFATSCAEGILSALMIAQIYSEKGKLSTLWKTKNKYYMERRKYICKKEKKDAIMNYILSTPQLEGKVSFVDGIRYDFEEGWLLIRPSGTEPAIRLTAEAKTEKKLLEIIKRAESIILEAINKAGG